MHAHSLLYYIVKIRFIIATKMETRVPSLKCLRTGKVGKGDQEQPLSPMARLFHEPGSNVSIIAILAFKTKINADIVKANMVHTLLKHARFTSLQVCTMYTNTERVLSMTVSAFTTQYLKRLFLPKPRACIVMWWFLVSDFHNKFLGSLHQSKTISKQALS